MKSITRLSVFLVMLFAGQIKAQYIFQTSFVNSIGDWAYTIKPGSPCFELGFRIKRFGGGFIDSKYSLGGTLGYFSLKPTQDTFPTYATGNVNGPMQLFPGYEVIHYYHALFVSFTNDYAFMANKRFSPVVGLDLDFFIISTSVSNYAETLEQSSSSGNDDFSASIVPRIGAQYKLSDNWLLSAGAGLNITYASSIEAQEYWKPYISIMYFPK